MSVCFGDMCSVGLFISGKSPVKLQILLALPQPPRPARLISMTKGRSRGKCFPDVLKAKKKNGLDVFSHGSSFWGHFLWCALRPLILGIKASLRLACFIELSVNYGLRTDIWNGWENRGKMLILFVDFGFHLFNGSKNRYDRKSILACVSLSKGSK